jgi:hypothetical protein
MSNLRAPSIPISERAVKATITPSRDRGAPDLTARQEEKIIASGKAHERSIRMASQQLAARIAHFHPERCGQ